MAINQNKTIPECFKDLILLEKMKSLSIDEENKYIKSYSPNVRIMVFLLSKNKEILSKSLFFDPCYKIRLLAIDYILDKQLLISLLNDESEEVRAKVLRHMKNLPNSFGFDENLLNEISYLINDINKFVRIELSLLLKRFINLNENFIKKLFDKNDIGLFIYGCEDEFKEVRENIIRSIEYFIGIEAIEFLIDMLNEDCEKIREIVSEVLKKCLKNGLKNKKLKLPEHLLSYILAFLDEKNLSIKNNILDILGIVRHFNEGSAINTYNNLLNRENINESDKLKCLFLIVKNNKDIFRKYVINNNIGILFENKQSLYNTKYVGDLIILFIIKPENLSKKIKEDLNFIDFKMKFIGLVDEEEFEESKLLLHNLILKGIIDEEFIIKDEVLNLVIGKPPGKDLPIESIKEIVKDLSIESIKEIVKDLSIESIKEIVKDLSIKSIKEIVKVLPIESIKEIVKDLSIESIKEIVKVLPIESIKEIVKVLPIESIKEIVKDLPIESIKEIVKYLPIESIKEIVKDLPIESIKEIVKDLPIEPYTDLKIETGKDLPIESINDLKIESPNDLSSFLECQSHFFDTEDSFSQFCTFLEQIILKSNQVYNFNSICLNIKVLMVLDLFYFNFNKKITKIKKKDFMIICPNFIKYKYAHLRKFTSIIEISCLFYKSEYFEIMLVLKKRRKMNTYYLLKQKNI